MSQQQCTNAVLMIRPAAFDYNPETAGTNAMQRRAGGDVARLRAQAAAEFERLAGALRDAGIQVCVVDDTPEPPKPDAVFPNNWVSFHGDGTVVLYPMQAESRRRERRREVVDAVADELGYRVTRVLDLTRHEAAGRFLEGTGSLVLDHLDRIAYAALSPRTHAEVVEEWAAELGYRPVVFRTADRAGVPLYHTNVLLCVGVRFAVVGAAAIVPDDRERVLESLLDSGREVIEIDQDAVASFAGNVLELASWDESLHEHAVLAMSASAHRALGAQALERLTDCTDEILAVPVPTIETLGGGSVRCMLAEVFLPE